VGLHVEIDRDVCMGSGNCIFQAPGAFELDDDGIATVVDPGAAPEESVRTAAARCPSRAITVTPPS
jgi:ferredoxin